LKQKQEYKNPKKGEEGRKCQFCGKKGVGIIRKYGLNTCRQCFREVAKSLGFNKYG